MSYAYTLPHALPHALRPFPPHALRLSPIPTPIPFPSLRPYPSPMLYDQTPRPCPTTPAHLRARVRARDYALRPCPASFP